MSYKNIMISIKHLSYRYPDGVLALDDVNLEIRKGEFVALLGRNGCGKSTLVRHLNALLVPSEGSVSIRGMDTGDTSNQWKIRQAVGMVFQNPQTQFVGMTVEEDVAFGLENLVLPQKEIRKRVDHALQNVGLGDYRTRAPKSLSGGQMQRAAIAGVLAMRPGCIILDEVTSMLDSSSRQEVMEIVRQLRESGKTIIYVTHQVEEVVNADRVIVMDAGKIVRDSMPQDIFKDPMLPHFGLDVPPLVELVNRLQDTGMLSGRMNMYSQDVLLEEICRSMSGA